MAKKLLRFFEYDRLHFNRSYLLVASDIPFEFGEKYQNALIEFHTVSKGAYFDLIHHGIRFCEQVGVIQVHDLVIEVLPKMDRTDTDDEKWHNILLDMLKACKLLLPKSSQDASLQLKSNSILELYFQKFIAELEYLLHAGLVKKYRKAEGNAKALKGSLIFHKQLQTNLVHAERFYTRHTIYDRDHMLHQILRQALVAVDQLNNSGALSDRIKCLLLDWPEGQSVAISEQLFKRITLNRKTEGYREALAIARLILLNYHPDIKAGRNQVMALLFNMNDLWEEFMYQRLKYAGLKNNWDVCAQKGLVYWAGESSRKKVIPDIVLVHKVTGKRIVIDTKWKRPPNYKPEDHDLRQLLAYKLYYHADQAFLLYPSREWIQYDGNFQEKGFRSDQLIFRDGMGLKGGLLFASVFQGQKIQRKDQFLDSELVTFLKNALDDYMDSRTRMELS